MGGEADKQMSCHILWSKLLQSQTQSVMGGSELLALSEKLGLMEVGCLRIIRNI